MTRAAWGRGSRATSGAAGAGCIGGVASSPGARARGPPRCYHRRMPLRLGVVTDIHHGPDSATLRGSAAPEALRRCLDALRGWAPDVLVDLGDRLTDETPEVDLQRLRTIAALFDASGMRREHLRGNHDVLPPEVQEELLGGPVTSRSLDLAGWHLVFLDAFDGSIGGVLTGETLAWFEADLGATSLPTIVFSHPPLDGQPLIGNPSFEVEYAAHAHPQGHELARRIMAASGRVRLAVNGHAHWNHEVVVAGVPHLTVQSLVARTVAGLEAGSYAIVELDDRSHRVRVFGGEPDEGLRRPKAT
jgi:3',5'-cyclic-AMP phosphodiesterase